MGKGHFIIPIFVPHYGCPHDCVFCNQKKITGSSTDVDPHYVRNTIEEYLTTLPKEGAIIEVAFYGGSFTGIEKGIQRDLLSVPLEYKDQGKIHGIRLSTRPDYIDREILELLKENSVDTIELGVQSLDDSVLNGSGRGHNHEQVYWASELIKEYKFNLGLQMMIGLINDNKEKAIFTGQEFVRLDPFCVRIYPTLIIKDTLLEKMYNDNIYKPLTLEEAVDISAHLLMLFEYNHINVIRIGLQATENIRIGRDVIAGPFHPSFRQLVESHIYRIILERHLNKLSSLGSESTMVIEVNEKNISNLVGQKSCNIKYLTDKYKIRSIKIYGSNIANDIIRVSIDGMDTHIYKGETIGNYLRESRII